MRKYGAWVTALMLAVSMNVVAQEDVTAQYVVNPSFENDNIASLTAVNNNADGLRGYKLDNPTGWSVSGASVVKLLVTADCYTDNNFGKVTTLADGTKAYYLRQGWSDGTSLVQQTLTGLPKGKYRLRVAIRSAYANQASSGWRIFAGDAPQSFFAMGFDQGSQGYFTSAEWKDWDLDFEMEEAGNINIGMKVDWLSGGSCVMFDNVRLYQLPDEYVEPEEPTEQEVESLTEGVITNAFVAEEEMKADLLQMLANFATYLKNDFQDCVAPNSVNEVCGCFKGENTMANDERGVRPNADLSMICAFLAKYGKGKVMLPEGVSWDDIETMAMKSLVFAYSTHKANKLKVCSGNNYWGSTSTSDAVWESSLWAMSVAYSAFFQWDKLSDAQKDYIYKLLKAECNYELYRSIPTGYAGDTKAEENGWEADILAATLGLFPNDPLAPQWFARLREFAINSYSHYSDADNTTVIDPDYDTKTVADLYKGKNLYDDYTLQNHNLFHTSYQNVVMQELGEAALALKLFQQGLYGEETWKTNALMHHNKEVQTEVLNWLALADGELAMPNGNDWSLFLYDQITSYSTNACFLRDADALMLENLAYKYIKARQQTTSDGSWLLRADVGARRMGVEAHRVMMTWLMHEILTTADMQASDWEDFRNSHSEARKIESQNIVRAYTPDRFTTFSWSSGLSSYTGYIASDSPDKNKIIVPFRANNTGNFLGWYEVSGKGTNATPVVNGIYDLRGDAWTMNGELNTNDATLNNRFALFSTPGNAVIYLDYVRANSAATISKEKGGLMAISTDELTRTKRTLYTQKDDAITHTQADGSQLKTFNSEWLNIDNELGFVSKGDKQMAFGDKANNNSVMTSKLYVSYDGQSRAVTAGQVVDRRNIIYYSKVNAEQTAQLSDKTVSLIDKVPAGWNGIMAFDPDGTAYLLLSNFVSDEKCVLTAEDVTVEDHTGTLYPVLPVAYKEGKASFIAEQNHSVSAIVKFWMPSLEIEAFVDPDDPNVCYVNTPNDPACDCIAVVHALTSSGMKEVGLLYNGPVKLIISGDEVLKEACPFPTIGETQDLTEGYEDITATTLANPNFEEDVTYGDATGNITLGSVTYNPCYVNAVSAVNSKWSNVLPVQGWTAGNQLTGGSNFCRMYSMPYSLTMYCVSPSNVGNYAAQCGRMISDEGVGERTLTVLNSWDKGANAITQTASLAAGEYRVVLNMKYECPNQTANDGSVVTTSGGNVNTSLTGVKVGGTADFRYPTQPNEWQQMAYDFVLDEAKDITISLGFQTSQGQGAANNTLLYIDNVRVLRKVATGISLTPSPSPIGEGSIYDLQGRRVITNSKLRNTSAEFGIRNSELKAGIYVSKGRKIIVK